MYVTPNTAHGAGNSFRLVTPGGLYLRVHTGSLRQAGLRQSDLRGLVMAVTPALSDGHTRAAQSVGHVVCENAGKATDSGPC